MFCQDEAMHNMSFHTQHGVLVKIHDTGVLITGRSGIGKSELALDLLSRGHTLIADDIVEIYVENQHLMGACPEMLFDFLHVKGLGLLKVSDLFGEQACLPHYRIDFNLHLEDAIPDTQTLTAFRLPTQQYCVCGHTILQYCFSVHLTPQLALWTEVLTRQFQLQQEGKNSETTFLRRHFFFTKMS